MTTTVRKYRGTKHGKLTQAYRRKRRRVHLQTENEALNTDRALKAEKARKNAEKAAHDRETWQTPGKTKDKNWFGRIMDKVRGQ